MKIVHLCLASFYIDDYSYQENLITKYHKKLGLDVEIIASLFTFDENGKPTYLDEPSTYINENGIKVTRLSYKTPKINRKLRKYNDTYKVLKESKPNILFIHGCQFLDMKVVVKYLKENPDVSVYVDNHADFSNSARNFLSRELLHKVLWRNMAQLIEPFTKKFYGVLPSRVDFLQNIYKIPSTKTELLVMGADDEKVEEVRKLNSREKIREKYKISDNDFLLMTGGKIDNAKKQTINLMKAIKEIPEKNIKLIVFGSVIPELKEEINRLSDNTKIFFIGWLNSETTYEYFAAADLVVFPGRHSVFWEQVAGQGIPMLVKWWEGTTHVDIGGNVGFLKEDSVTEIKNAVLNLYYDRRKYVKMYLKANQEGKNSFLYSKISKKSIELK